MPELIPFSFSDEWPCIRSRYEAWWAGERLDRPLVRVTAPVEASPPEPPPPDPDGLLAWLTDPEQVLPRLERGIWATHYAGDAFPWIDPVSLGLAAIQAAYHCAPYRIATDPLTGWTEPVITDWASRPGFEVDAENSWWKITRRLLEVGAQRSAGRYAISIPDLQGGGEILALLRGTQRLALDLRDCPEEILPALEEINTAWLHFYNTCYDIIHGWQEGYVDWLGIWSDAPAVTVECDFSVMISAEMFERFFLPAVAQQVAWIGRAVYHLDGPGAIRHLEALLALPGLRAIQWIPTPEHPRLAGWIPLLKRIQAGGKSVVIACEQDEVLPLLKALDPSGVILTTTCASPAEADALVDEVKRRFR